MWKFALYSSVKVSRQLSSDKTCPRVGPVVSVGHSPFHPSQYESADPSTSPQDTPLPSPNKPDCVTPSDGEEKETKGVKHTFKTEFLKSLSFSEKKQKEPARTPTREDLFLARIERNESVPFDPENIPDEAEALLRQESLIHRLKYNVVDPTSRFKYCWLCVMTLVVVYNCTMIIARVTFHQLQDYYYKVWLALDFISDFLYVVDIFIKTRTSYLSANGKTQKKPALLLKHYCESVDIRLDVLSILPTDLLYFALPEHYPLVRLNRLLRWKCVTKFFDRTTRTTKYSTVFRVVNLVIYIMIIIHWNACFYFAISTEIGLGSDVWVYPVTNSSTLSNISAYVNSTSGAEEDFSSLSNKYIYSFYWSTLTLLAIGETPHPVTNTEYVFTVADFLVGILIFATIVGNVGSMISNVNHERGIFNQRIDAAKRYMKIRSVDSAIERKILHWFDYIWSNQHTLDEKCQLALLPDKLRARIALHVHIETLSQVSIFRSCEPGFLMELVLKLKLQVFCPGDYVCRRGDIGREMFIIKSGMLKVINDSGEVLATLYPGAVFGEISVLEIPGCPSGNRRMANVISIGYSDCLALSKKDLWTLLKDYPETRKDLIEHGRELLQYSEQSNKTVTSSDNAMTSIDNVMTSSDHGITSSDHAMTSPGSRPSSTAVRVGDWPANCGNPASGSGLPTRMELEQRVDNLLIVMESVAQNLTEISAQFEEETAELVGRLTELEKELG